MLQILADENMPRLAVDGLRAAGHDVLWVAEYGPQSLDEVIVDDAGAAGRIILTQDQDFADMAFRDGVHLRALIHVAVEGLSIGAKAARIVAAVNEIGEAAWGKLHIIEPARIRSRPLPSPPPP